MTLFTPNYSFPDPELSDQPNGPAQISALANAVDTQLKSTDNTVAANAAIVTASGTPGAWTPTFTGMNNNAAAAFIARYIKNGKGCYLSVRFTPAATADLGVGVPAFTLPFTASASAALVSGVGRILDGAGNNRPLWPIINPSATTCQLFGLNSSLQWVAPGGAGYSWGNSSVYEVSITYETI